MIDYIKAEDSADNILVLTGKISGKIFISDPCPFCGEQHRHGLPEGHRIAHCHERNITIKAPDGTILTSENGYILKMKSVTPPMIYDELEPGKLHLVFSNILSKRQTGMSKHAFVVMEKKGGNMVAELFYLSHNQWRFVIDNFPAQRKFYNTNMPYKTYEDFMADLERIDIKLFVDEKAV